VAPVDIGLLSVAFMLVMIYAGMHVAVALLTVSFLGVWLITGRLSIAANLLGLAAADSVAGYAFGVVPLFIFMGLMVSVADLGRDAFEVANQAFRRVRGGLGIATVAANAVFAAITGISIAAAAVFTKVAVPEMLKLGYRPRFAVGVVAGSSVLGMLIPPSLLLIVFGILSEQSIGHMFLAGIMPGLILAAAFSLCILGMAYLTPGYVGAAAISHFDSSRRLGPWALTAKITPITGLIVAVLGGIYGGFFTATEAAAVGAFGALLLALAKRRLTPTDFWTVLVETGQVTVSILILIIAASIYSRMLALAGVPAAIEAGITGFGFGFYGFLVLYIAVVILLGTILDSVSILLIAVPLALPTMVAHDVSLVWFGIVTVIAVEIGLLTPPLGLSVYVIKSALEDPSISLGDVFYGAFPFAVIMLATLVLIVAFPGLSLVFL
jgi:C4-dicarboxylate transporter, DctM subunit